jgi:hypothetical protein
MVLTHELGRSWGHGVNLSPSLTGARWLATALFPVIAGLWILATRLPSSDAVSRASA